MNVETIYRYAKRVGCPYEKADAIVSKLTIDKYGELIENEVDKALEHINNEVLATKRAELLLERKKAMRNFIKLK